MATNYGANIRLTAQDTTAAALASLRKNLGDISKDAVSLRGVFGALVPTVTIAGAALFVKNINDGVDALNDFKDATGSSIENASALEDIAARTGTSFDTVTTSVVKFNQALAEAKPDSDISKALQSIGLEANKLKGLDPAEALRQTAVALSKFADDGNRARLVQELFGRSVKEVAPFLNDLAKQTELVATVTTQQAEAAEEFNKQLFELSKNAKDAGRALTADLVTGLNYAAKAFKEGGFVEGLRGLFGGDDEFKASKTLIEDTEKLLNLENALAGARAQGLPEQGRIIQNMLEQKKQTEENIRLAQNYLKVLRGEDGLTGASAAAPAKSVDFDPDRDKRTKEANDKWLAENKKAREQDLAGWVKYADDRVNEDFDSAKQIAESQIKLNDELLTARETMMQQWFATIDQEQEDAIAAGRAVIDAAAEDTKRLGDAGRELGFTFSSAFEDAVVGGKKTREILQGILDDITRIALRKNVTEPFSKAVSGINFGSLFGGGGGGADVPIDGYAGGGYTGSGSRTGGLDGQGGFLAMLHPQETVVDHVGGMQLAIAGGGGSSNVIVNVIESPGRGGQQATRQEGGRTVIDVMVEQIKTAVAGDIMRGSGVIPDALSHSYGLNRAAGAY